jgi:hypothetical protein
MKEKCADDRLKLQVSRYHAVVQGPAARKWTSLRILFLIA